MFSGCRREARTRSILFLIWVLSALISFWKMCELYAYERFQVRCILKNHKTKNKFYKKTKKKHKRTDFVSSWRTEAHEQFRSGIWKQNFASGIFSSTIYNILQNLVYGWLREACYKYMYHPSFPPVSRPPTQFRVYLRHTTLHISYVYVRYGTLRTYRASYTDSTL